MKTARGRSVALVVLEAHAKLGEMPAGVTAEDRAFVVAALSAFRMALREYPSMSPQELVDVVMSYGEPSGDWSAAHG